jgi:hypothetical protein
MVKISVCFSKSRAPAGLLQGTESSNIFNTHNDTKKIVMLVRCFYFKYLELSDKNYKNSFQALKTAISVVFFRALQINFAVEEVDGDRVGRVVVVNYIDAAVSGEVNHLSFSDSLDELRVNGSQSVVGCFESDNLVAWFKDVYKQSLELVVCGGE